MTPFISAQQQLYAELVEAIKGCRQDNWLSYACFLRHQTIDSDLPWKTMVLEKIADDFNLTEKDFETWDVQFRARLIADSTATQLYGEFAKTFLRLRSNQHAADYEAIHNFLQQGHGDNSNEMMTFILVCADLGITQIDLAGWERSWEKQRHCVDACS